MNPEWAEKMPTKDELIILKVIEMREAQKRHYKSKLNSHRDLAKIAEKAVDELLWERANPDKERRLF